MPLDPTPICAECHDLIGCLVWSPPFPADLFAELSCSPEALSLPLRTITTSTTGPSHTYMPPYTYVYGGKCAGNCLQNCLYVYIYTYRHIYVYVHAYTCMHLHVYIHMHVVSTHVYAKREALTYTIAYLLASPSMYTWFATFRGFLRPRLQTMRAVAHRIKCNGLLCIA